MVKSGLPAGLMVSTFSYRVGDEVDAEPSEVFDPVSTCVDEPAKRSNFYTSTTLL